MNNLNEEVLKNIQITSQENIIIKSFEKFYENKENINLLITIINSKSNISIRLIDYFVTKYSKQYKISYKINDENDDYIFNAYISYKQQLKAYQKKYFDPFSRGPRIPYFFDDTCIITTIGQLNFFKWFISKKIYEYIYINHDIIENDMNKNNKINKSKIKKERKKKKYTLNHNQSQNYNIQHTAPIINTNKNIIVSFSF